MPETSGPKPEIPQASSLQLDALRQQRETRGIYVDIARVEGEQLKKAQEMNLGSVGLEGLGTFYRLPSGDWRGPGGNYGPSTELGKKLDAAFSARQEQPK